MTKIKKKEKQKKLNKSDKVKKPKDFKNKLQLTKKIKQKKNVLQKALKTAVDLSQKSTKTAEDESKTDISAEVKIISKPKDKKKTSPKKEQKIKKVKKNTLENKNNADEPSSQGISDETSQGKKVHDPEEAERTVFIGNLPPNTKKAQLIKLFSNFGEIKSVRFRSADGVVMFKHQARKAAESINGYVVMKDLKIVESVLKLSGMEFKGHHLRITRATKSTVSADSKRIVFIGNLKYSATDEKLFNIFSSCGEIEYVRTLQSNKGCKGVAFVCFKKSESVGLALELNNTILDERPIHVERYSKNKLGAREKRQEEEDKELKGALKRIKDKNKKVNKKDKNIKNIEKQSLKETKKKSQFRGVQIDFKKKIKKKKKIDKMLQLAKKIAPKS